MDVPTTILFPLNSELEVIENITNVIPRHEFIKRDLRELSRDEVYIIERYAMYTLPNVVWGDYFYNIHRISNGLEDRYKRLSRFQLIISPGDSPAKYITIFNLLGWKLPPVVSFPLSGL